MNTKNSHNHQKILPLDLSMPSLPYHIHHLHSPYWIQMNAEYRSNYNSYPLTDGAYSTILVVLILFPNDSHPLSVWIVLNT